MYAKKPLGFFFLGVLFCFVFLAQSCLIVNMNGLISQFSPHIYLPLYSPHIIVSAIGKE